MAKEMDFFIFLLEHYAAEKHTSADKILKQWDEWKLTSVIYGMYWRYHTECIENAYRDIDQMIEEKQGTNDNQAAENGKNGKNDRER